MLQCIAVCYNILAPHSQRVNQAHLFSPDTAQRTGVFNFEFCWSLTQNSKQRTSPPLSIRATTRLALSFFSLVSATTSFHLHVKGTFYITKRAIHIMNKTLRITREGALRHVVYVESAPSSFYLYVQESFISCREPHAHHETRPIY